METLYQVIVHISEVTIVFTKTPLVFFPLLSHVLNTFSSK